MTRLRVEHPWLFFELGSPMQVLSWALNNPGFVISDRIVWREVRNADLPPDLDVGNWFRNELANRDALESVAFLTSRDIRQVKHCQKTVGQTTAVAVATVGLSNAERIGHRVDHEGKDWGTINVALQLDSPLSKGAMIETLSIAVQARTTAVIDVAHHLPVGIATGTGTDCIAVCAPEGDVLYAGLHTEIGEAVGGAVYDAVVEGAREWIDTVHLSEILSNRRNQ